MPSNVALIRDAVPIDVPNYLHVLTGHYVVEGSRYYARRQRGTNDWLLTATIAGAGRFGSGSKQFNVQAHDIVLIRPGSPHDYGSTNAELNWEFMWAHFHPRPHWLEWLTSADTDSGIIHVHADASNWPKILSAFRAAHRFVSHDDSYHQDLTMHEIESILLHTLGSSRAKTARTLDERIATAIAVINTNLSSEIDINLLAESAALSPSRFAHLFKEQVGMTPMQYVDSQRIQRAKRLLTRTSSSITQIASDVGYNSIHFSNRFKQLTGVSPREFRRQ